MRLTAGLAGVLLLLSFAPSRAGENLLRNSSFEMGSEEWGTPVMMDYDAPSMDWHPPVSDAAAKIHGDVSLRLDNPDGHRMELATHELLPEPGAPHIFSIWLKSDRPATVTAMAFDVTHRPPEIPNRWWSRKKDFEVTTEWARYSFPLAGDHPGKLHILLRWEAKTLWADAAMFHRGTEAAEYAPRAPIEMAFAPGSHIRSPGESMKVLAWNGTDVGKTVETVLGGEDCYFGTKLPEIKQAWTLPPGRSEREYTPPLDRYGVFRLDGVFPNGDVPSCRVAVVGETPRGTFDPARNFGIGLGGGALGMRRDIVDWGQRYGALEGGYDDYVAALRRQGIRFQRLHDDYVFNWPALCPEKGEYGFQRGLDRLLAAARKHDMTLLVVLGAEGFLKPLDKEDPHRDWFVRRHSVPNGEPVLRGKFQAMLPRMEDWRDYVRELARRCRGGNVAYEVLNEPNLYLSPGDYIPYLRVAHEEIKKIDPGALVVGLSATGDLGGNTGRFIEECVKLGALDYFDVVSIHPYNSTLDSSPFPAPRELEKIRALVDRFRPGLPIWNTEAYYLNPVPFSGYSGDWFDNECFPARNLMRRYLIDLRGGLAQSICLSGQQAFDADLWPGFGYRSTYCARRLTPNALFVVNNAFARFFEGAKPEGAVSLLAGVNCYLYRDRENRETAALWAIREGEGFTFSPPAGFAIYDLFGNPLAGEAFRLDGNPVILRGSGLAAALRAATLVPDRAVAAVGARYTARDGKPVMGIEVRNNGKDPRKATLRRIGDKTPVTREIPPQDSILFTFPAGDVRDGEVEFLLAEGGSIEKAKFPVAAIRFARPGETVRLGDSEFVAAATPECFRLNVRVKDARRGGRVADKPWEGDTVELFFDALPERNLAGNHYHERVYRLFLSPASANGLPAEITGSANIDVDAVRWKLDDTGTDFAFDVEIPWRALGLEGPSPLGFDVAVDDANTDDGKRESQTVWSSGGPFWVDRSRFGMMVE